jgi:hypothetical protein
MTDDEVTAFEWTRLAVPIPPMLPSLNQIGFDYMNWLIGPVMIAPPDANNAGKVILWAIGATRNEVGELVVDTDTDFRLPLNGRFQNDAFILSNRSFNMAITGIPIPFNIFQLRGRLGQDLQVLPGARAYAETKVLSIPTFGIPMVIAGLANKIWKKLVAMATYITKPYPSEGSANKKPAGVHVKSVVLTNGQSDKIVATVEVENGHSYPVDKHIGAILLVNKQNNELIQLDYHKHLTQSGDANNNLHQIELTLPKNMRLPEQTLAIVILDVFPMHECTLAASQR